MSGAEPGSVLIETMTLPDGSTVETRTTTLRDGNVEKTVTTFPPGGAFQQSFQNEPHNKVSIGPAPVASTAVPMGNVSTVAGQDQPKAPRGMVIAIVSVDSIALLFWCISWAVPYIAIGGAVCMITGCILAFILPCNTSDPIFKAKIKGVLIAHIVTIALYIATIVLVIAAAAQATTTVATSGYDEYGNYSYNAQAASATTGLAIGAIIASVCTFVGQIVSLSLAGVLLCKVNGGEGCC